MALHTTIDVVEIKRLLSDALADDPVTNTIFSSILVGVEQDDAAPWAAHPVGEPLVLATRSQRQTPVTLTPNWTDPDEIAAAIAALEPPAGGVAGDPDVVEVVVRRIARPEQRRTDERLFRLDELVPPPDVPGLARPATTDDTDLLVAWFLDFGAESFGRRPAPDDARRQIVSGSAHGRTWLWTVDGATVAFAHRHAGAAGVARIGPVYTPPAFRRRGYGSAATAAAARDILDSGAVPCLYTDLANPTSNHIYQSLGFRPVLDRCSVRFG